MTKFARITAYAITALLLLGCSESQIRRPKTEGIKLADLTRSRPASVIATSPKIALDFYTLEMPADKIQELSIIWQSLYTKPIYPADPGTFTANSFNAVFGESAMWDNTAVMLQSAGAIKIDRIKFLIKPGQTDTFSITRIPREKTFFYFKPDQEADIITFEPSRLILNLKLSQTPDIRGAYDLNLTPKIIPADPYAPLSAETLEKRLEVFHSLSFTARISDGNFLLFGPAQYPQNRKALNNLFFAPPVEDNKIRLYAIFCSTVAD